MAKRGPVDLRQVANSRSIGKEFKPAVLRAAEYGWSGRWTGSGGLQMTSPDGSARTYVPSSIRDGVTATKKMIHTIESWAKARDEVEIEESTTRIAHGVGLEREEIEVQHGASPTIRCKEHDVEFMSWEGLSQHVRESHTESDPVSDAIRAVEQVTNTHEEGPVRIEDMKFEGDPEEDGLDELVAQGEALSQSMSSAASGAAKMEDEDVRPWRPILARNDDGTVDLYESEAVLEVTTTGGHKVFRCSLEGCGYESALPRSVVSHYAAHVRAGEAEPVTRERTVVAAGVRPTFYKEGDLARQVLSREIYVAMRSRRRSTGESMSVYADALAEKIVANRIIAGEVVTEGIVEETVRSDADVLLDRIRDLLGVNTADELAGLREALADEQAARENAEAKAKRLGETLRTMAELASEETE